MAENYITRVEDGGSINISEDVIATMVKLAVREVEGVAAMASTAGPAVADLLGKKNVSKGVKVQFNEDGSISIDLHIVVDNVNMNAVGESIIEEVRHQVTECTGTEVREVNVYVDSMMIG